jgi:non-specific serine/threonine protein kinase
MLYRYFLNAFHGAAQRGVLIENRGSVARNLLRGKTEVFIGSQGVLVSVESAVVRSGNWDVDLGRRELRLNGAPVDLGARAFDIVEVLAGAGGGLVTKDELMNRVWPDVVVEENTLQVHISALRKALGADRSLLKTEAGRGYRLIGDWTLSQGRQSGLAPPQPADPKASASPGNIPAAASDLFGRAALLMQLRELVSTCRIVTLTGVGGIGKTSLALALARSLSPEFPDGAWLAELASVSDPARVSDSIASALRLTGVGAETSPDVVGMAIGGQSMLIVLDNCEHVIESAARCAATLVRNCPNIRIVTTSREVLRIDGEQAFRVAPLNPPPEDDDDLNDLIDNDAVQLFITRMDALQSEPIFEPTALSTIAAICRRLDGIPLAIEFAAARAAMLGVRQVAARLDNRFDLLTGGRRTSLPRHQTLRAALDWSYDLLPADERRLFRHLGLFSSGFTLEAAAGLLGTGGVDDASAVEGLSNLVAKSLVIADGQPPGGRWRMLETVRAYALEKLREKGEIDEAERRREFLNSRL